MDRPLPQFGNPQPSGCLLSSCVAWLVTFKKPMDYQWKCQSDVGACNSRFKFWYLHGSLCISSALKMFSWCKVQMGMPFLCKNTQTKGIAHGTQGMDMVKQRKGVAANHFCEVGMKAQSLCFLSLSSAPRTAPEWQEHASPQQTGWSDRPWVWKVAFVKKS